MSYFVLLPLIFCSSGAFVVSYIKHVTTHGERCFPQMCPSQEMIPQGTLRTQRSLQTVPATHSDWKSKAKIQQACPMPGSPGRVWGDLLWSSWVTVTELWIARDCPEGVACGRCRAPLSLTLAVWWVVRNVGLQFKGEAMDLELR